MKKEELLDLIKTHEESEIIDFKENLRDGQEIGEYISSLGNSALIAKMPAAYLIWGIKDVTKEFTNTNFNYQMEKASKKNQMPLVTFLEKGLSPRIPLTWEDFYLEDNKVTLLTIDVTHVNKPISFYGIEYIRSGSSKTNLREFPEKARQLWLSFESSKFELEIARHNLTFEEVGSLLNLSFYAEQKGLPFDSSKVISALLEDNVIKEIDDRFNITNMGAYVLAKNLSEFPTLLRRTPRITRYFGNKTTDNAISDQKGRIGIGVGFNNVIKNIMSSIPYTEDYSEGTRKNIPMYPQIAIRELVANALVHQDFSVHGSRPFIEIFDSKIRISNPGIPIIEPKRFLDFNSKSRNEELADLLGELNIVESRGTGIDKVVDSLESARLPAMNIKVQGTDTTVITLKKKIDFSEMDVEERSLSIYWHASLRYHEDGGQITNSSLRERFHLNDNAASRSTMTKAINIAIDHNLIKKFDSSASTKFIKYVPFWGDSIDN